MKFLIITHAQHKKQREHLFAYEPYVREMNLWLKYAEKVEIVAPLVTSEISKIEQNYEHKDLILTQIPSIEFTTISSAIKSIFKLPIILVRIFKASKKSDHIHLRCPGNIGLLGCLVQICFPKKMKTAKYAGNWDPKAKQPLSYRLQKWILSNTFLTKNMQVLVYGNWPNLTKNIKPFFTASFKDSEKETWLEKDYSRILRFVFAGSLVEGKGPLFAIQIVENLHKKGKKVFLDVFGDGVLKDELQEYVMTNNIKNIIEFHGNQPKDILKETFKNTHFALLPSKSEGWPKVIAEAMFFGVIPITTSASCLPYMLDYGKRGILIEPNLDDAVLKIMNALENKDLKTMSRLGLEWSQQFTLDYFESEIKKLIISK